MKIRTENRKQFLAGFESHLKSALLSNGELGECYLQSAYSACALKALGMNPRLVAGRFGVKNSGFKIPHAWVTVDGEIFDPSGKLNIDLLWDDGDVAEYSPFYTCQDDRDLMGEWLDCRTVTEYLMMAPNPSNALRGCHSRIKMTGIGCGARKAVNLMDSIRWERAK